DFAARDAPRLSIQFGGGMRDPKLARGADVEAIRRRFAQGGIWTVNDHAVLGHVHHPLFELARGRSYVLALDNDTAFHHPIHLHGMPFLVLARDGRRLPRAEWRDTAIMRPGEKIDLGLVAETPGDWMFHCHILEHQDAGMMTTLRIS
ncbi:MAG: multicopper oxidase family protein, partial [Alphaproteobacteria bacterium]|nr:multicopper oxidase family protein [Alphaproteobacteria bacterium]